MMIVKRIVSIFLIVASLLFSVSSYAQDGRKSRKKDKDVKVIVSGLEAEQELARQIGSRFAVPDISYEPIVEPKFWKKGMLAQLGFSQMSLSNWASGGSGSIAMNAYTNLYLNYTKGNVVFENRGQFAYGFVQSFEDGYKKADDKIIIDSKFGYRAFDKFYFSSLLNFKTQFSPGFNYPSSGGQTLVSKFLSPANFSFGIGLDYKPGKGKVLSLNFSPLTTTWMIVMDERLRSRYGNEENEAIRYELGAQFTGTLKTELLKRCKIQSTLQLFSDYLNNPDNIQVNWNFQTDIVLTKFLVTSLRTNLIYNDKILIADKNGVLGRRVQFQEILSINFSYTFGEFKK